MEPKQLLENNSQYGFLCPQTNTFYVFQDQDEYRNFLLWIETAKQNQHTQFENNLNKYQMDADTANSTPNQQQEQLNFQSATKQIMKIFSDPMFSSTSNQTNYQQFQLQQVDF